MSADIIQFRPKTRAEQKLQYLEGLGRPLTDEESDQLRRSLHAVYCRNLRLAKAHKVEREAYPTALAEHRHAEAETYAKALREARS